MIERVTPHIPPFLIMNIRADESTQETTINRSTQSTHNPQQNIDGIATLFKSPTLPSIDPRHPHPTMNPTINLSAVDEANKRMMTTMMLRMNIFNMSTNNPWHVLNEKKE
eukprot:786901_1